LNAWANKYSVDASAIGISLLAPAARTGRTPAACIFILDDVCMAWLMNALSQAPALTSEQLQRARRRLAQP